MARKPSTSQGKKASVNQGKKASANKKASTSQSKEAYIINEKEYYIDEEEDDGTTATKQQKIDENLFTACMEGNLPEAAKYLEKGADPSVIKTMTYTCTIFEALIDLPREKIEKIVKLIGIFKYVPLDIVNEDEHTALYEALWKFTKEKKECLDFITLFIDLGAKIPEDQILKGTLEDVKPLLPEATLKKLLKN